MPLEAKRTGMPLMLHISFSQLNSIQTKQNKIKPKGEFNVKKKGKQIEKEESASSCHCTLLTFFISWILITLFYTSFSFWHSFATIMQMQKGPLHCSVDFILFYLFLLWLFYVQMKVTRNVSFDWAMFQLNMKIKSPARSAHFQFKGNELSTEEFQLQCWLAIVSYQKVQLKCISDYDLAVKRGLPDRIFVENLTKKIK